MKRSAVKAVASDGFLREWLTLGSIPGNPPQLMHTAEFVQRTALPNPNDRAAGLVWAPLVSPSEVIDFMRDAPKFAHHLQCAAYLHAYVWSPVDRTAFFAFGSDDGAVVWMNGARVFAVDATRGVTLDGDLVPVALRSGWNRILVKVLQYAGGWQFAGRFLAADKSIVTGLKYSLSDPLDGKWPVGADAGHVILSVTPPSEDAILLGPSTPAWRFTATILNPSDKPSRPGTIRVSTDQRSPADAASFGVLAPLEQARVDIEVPAREWANAYRSCLRFQAARGSETISLAMELKPSVIEAIVMAAAEPPPALAATERTLLKRIVADVSGGMEAVRLTPALEPALPALATALLESSPVSIRAALRDVDRIITGEHRALARTAVHLVSHAHIDMNWLWQWPETVHICRDTFAQAIRFMDEFPEFVFNQSQASCYEAMELEAPDVFGDIRAAVAAGRWHITGGMWTEGDTNLSSGEAIARSFTLAQRYFRDKFGTIAKAGWLPDNFGHTAQLPQLMKLAGISGFYHMRCAPNKDSQLYWWEALDGTRVLAKTGVPYGAQVTPAIRSEPAKVPGGVGEQMTVYGVGDHGGGPTRKDITTALRFAQSRLMPRVHLSTAQGYFDTVRPKAKGVPVHHGELNFTLTGCYTSVAAIKEGNRALENALNSAESAALSAMLATGATYPKAAIDRAWKTLLFNEFHDILPGSAIHESNRDSVARYSEALEQLRLSTNTCLRAIADNVNTGFDDGVPVVVYNALAWTRTDVVVAEVVVTERFSYAAVVDEHGVSIPAQSCAPATSTATSTAGFSLLPPMCPGWATAHSASASPTPSPNCPCSTGTTRTR